jgi:alpha 1,3-glucosidase
MHEPNNKQPLYGSVPYITSVHQTHSAAVAWVNAAHTYVTITDLDQGKHAVYLSESGALEFFTFAASTHGSSNRIKKVQEDLAIVSGYIPLPLLHTLGFHFCKWNSVSSAIIIDRNKKFTEGNFPVDVLWMDIEWADQRNQGNYQYFYFNPTNFTTKGIEDMNS